MNMMWFKRIRLLPQLELLSVPVCEEVFLFDEPNESNRLAYHLILSSYSLTYLGMGEKLRSMQVDVCHVSYIANRGSDKMVNKCCSTKAKWKHQHHF